jgi:hypothetical protein
MDQDSSQETVLCFEISVQGGSYRSLVDSLSTDSSRLRGRIAPRAPVKAAIELDLGSGHYSLTTLGKHRLPRSLKVSPGSRTHSNLTSYIASHLTGDTAKTISALLTDIIQTAPSVSPEALKLFREDIELRAAKVSSASDARQNVFVVNDFNTEILIDLDDVPTLNTPDTDTSSLEEAAALLRASARLVGNISAQTDTNLVEVSAVISLPKVLLSQTDIFIHWGSYDEPSLPWQDEIVSAEEDDNQQAYKIRHIISTPARGEYGFTLFLQIRGSTDPVWLGTPWLDDARITVHCDDSEGVKRREELLESA